MLTFYYVDSKQSEITEYAKNSPDSGPVEEVQIIFPSSTIDEVSNFSTYLGLRITGKKPKVLDLNIIIDYPLEKVESFVHLGSEMDSKGGCDEDVNRRIFSSVFPLLEKHLRVRKEIMSRTKISIHKSTVRAVVLYAVKSRHARPAHGRTL